MGSVNCCKKPNEVEISGNQNNVEVLNTDQISPLEKDDSYPQDSEQKYKNAGVSNQEIYNEQAQASKDGNVIEVQIDDQNPNENQQNNDQNDQNGQLEHNEQNAEETHNLQNSYGERGIEGGFEVDNGENEQHEDSPKVEDTNQEQVENQDHEEERDQKIEIQEIQESNIVQPLDKDQDQEDQYKNVINDFGDTLGATNYINDASSGANVQQQVGDAQQQSFQNAEDINKYFSDVSNSNINTLSLIQNNNSQLMSSGDVNNLQYASTTAINGSQINPNEDINKYFQQNTGANIDLNNLGTLSTVPAPTGNEDYNKYFTNMPGATSTTTNYDINNIVGTSSIPAPTGNEDINKYFQNIETTNSTTPGFSSVGIVGTSSTIPAPTGVVDMNNYLNNNINLGQTTATGTFDLNAVQTTTSTAGNVDLSQFGINSSTANENVDLSQYGLGIASAVQPQSNDNDINKYFQQNAASTSMNGNFDLNNLNNVNVNNAEFSSMVIPQSGNYNLGGAESHITFGDNNFSSYELKQNQVITTSKQESSYVSPVQSYSYNYSYTMPATSQVSK